MEIKLQGLSKCYGSRWLFRDLNYTFGTSSSWSITGHNGSGKTTLIQIIAGLTPASEGSIKFTQNGNNIDEDHWYRYLWLAAPYIELLEELTLEELWRFHSRLKPMQKLSAEEFAERCQLAHALNKPIHQYSSGMKQRVKLALGFWSSLPVLLLDEPTTNLDQIGQKWYHQEMQSLLSNKLVIVCSNQPQEYSFCQNNINLGQP